MKGALPSAAKGISATNDFIIKSHEAALRPLLGPVVQKQGASDLALGPLKFSGNAQRRKRNFLLYHGTFLLDFDLPLIERLLPLPSRQPDYRRNRSHEDFLTNVSLPAREIKRRLQQLWRAADPLKELPLAPIDRLAVSRYASDDWNFKF
jgi:lipoate-protein ligase A